MAYCMIYSSDEDWNGFSADTMSLKSKCRTLGNNKGFVMLIAFKLYLFCYIYGPATHEDFIVIYA